MDSAYEEVKFATAPGPAPGRARIAFAEEPLGRCADAVAGRLGTWAVACTVGAGGIARSGGMGLWWSCSGFRFSLRPQAIFPERRGYVTASTTGAARLELRVNSRDPGHSRHIAMVRLPEDPLADGDIVTLRFNEPPPGGCGGLSHLNVALGVELHVGVDADGSGTFVEVTDSPLTINLIADARPASYLVLGPSTVSPEDSSAVQVVALDACGNLAPQAAAELCVEAPGCAGLPERVSLNPLDGGRKRFPGVSFPPGVNRVRLVDRTRDIHAVSQPIRCAAEQTWNVYWGDLHNHAYDSSLWLDLTPTTDPDYNYRYGRDVSRLDFCAVNFHLYLENGFNDQDRAWQQVQDAAARYHVPGQYVTFSAFEYHGFGGDRCQIFNGDILPEARLEEIYGANTRRPLESEADLGRLFDFAATTGSMLTGHVGGNPADMGYHDPRVQWSAEVASMHGNFEWFAQRALQQSTRVGFHGSSDGHVQTPGHPRRPGSGGRNGDFNRRDTGYGSGALTGVLAAELTREALWEAFRARRTYATTGARMLLDFRVDGRAMGEEVTLTGPPEIRAEVVGAGAIERLEVIRDDRLILTRPGEGDELRFSFVDADCPRGEHYYYLRVSQEDGEFGWSSPIWVQRADGPEAATNSLPLWNADDPEVRAELSEGEARGHERCLQDYLEQEEDAHRWHSLRATRVVPSPMGRYALLLAHDRKHDRPVHFKLFLDYEDIVLRMDLGWRDFGQHPNLAAMAFADYGQKKGARAIH